MGKVNEGQIEKKSYARYWAMDVRAKVVVMGETVTKAEFARRKGWHRSYVTRLAAENRLVLDGTGPKARVKVAESEAALAQTMGNRDDVAARHAENRGADAPSQQPASQIAPAAPKTGPVGQGAGLASGEGGEPDPESFGPLAAARHAKILAESRRAVALAEREEIERDKLAGELLERSEVELAFKAVGAQIRSLMETYPDQVAPLVAPVATLEDCHALLSEQCRNVLSNFSAAMQRQAEALQKGGAA